MAGVTARCKGCNRDFYDEDTVGMRERGNMCSLCDDIISTISAATPKMAKTAVNSWEDVSYAVGRCREDTQKRCTAKAPVIDRSSPNNLVERAKNLNLRELLKVQYRAALAHFTHAQLFDYVVSLLDNHESYEAEGRVESACALVASVLHDQEEAMEQKGSNGPECGGGGEMSGYDPDNDIDISDIAF